ncbi:site-specific DNA-methyltransferase [Parvularcula sp. IMCC14364]|uniref:site-specific DNA-methyltransferase n=1 Tax=Parvularcula sp. IMCC14364 TaxID=3067902 RepID=UPI002741B2AB|nr:site-specific DNA-methyltransferase [Parvularcula sp. IMCC14364]
MARKSKSPKKVETLSHEHETRKNIPTAELQSINEQLEEMTPAKPVAYPRARPLPRGEHRERDGDLDPQIVWNGMKIRITEEQRQKLAETGELELGDAQLVWRGKDTQDWSDLIVNVPPVYMQEKIHPKALIDDLVRRSKAKEEDDAPDLFADFNGIDPEARTEFYEHDQHWSNRMILGDSLQVMASLAEREQLRGKVQCIYFDPPYGIRFSSNWQVSTRSRTVTDGKSESLTREPEQVKAFRDTWKDGIHSYLTYLRDRMTVMRDLLTESGSIFVQIGDENVHRVRAVMDEVFGEECFVLEIVFKKTAGLSKSAVSGVTDYILWYCKDSQSTKLRRLFDLKPEFGDSAYSSVRLADLSSRRMTKQERAGVKSIPEGASIFRQQIALAAGLTRSCVFDIDFQGKSVPPKRGASWKSNFDGMHRLKKAERLQESGSSLAYVRFLEDFPVNPINNFWADTASGSGMDKVYVVQTNAEVVKRCILMATDPGDLVLDPTCGSGTTATVAEQWGRRWITIDTSRVALALARTRLMSAKYPYYLLADSTEGKHKEGELTGKVPSGDRATSDIRQGFVYERAPHITLKSIANNAEIDVIWDKWQEVLEPLREKLNATLGQQWEEWEIPREADDGMPDGAKALLEKWWDARIARQKEIDASIAQKADVEYLYDRPYEDKSRIRVAGPFTVESLSPHRVVAMDDQELLDEPTPQQKKRKSKLAQEVDFVQVILENLRTAGVQQGAREDRINFTTIAPWPGEMVHAEGRFMEGNAERRAAILIGPEYGTLHRTDIMAAAREASEARFDILITCAFGYDAHASDVTKLGPLNIIKAKMNPDLHMAEDLRRDKNANLFMVIGEPDVDIIETGDELQVQIHGMDIFVPATGEIRSGETDDIAAWFIDTDYNEESFFVRHAYFLGGNDPYKSLKSALKAEIDEEAWETLRRDTSRPFPRPESGRIAVKVINHYGDEVMKVFSV